MGKEGERARDKGGRMDGKARRDAPHAALTSSWPVLTASSSLRSMMAREVQPDLRKALQNSAPSPRAPPVTMHTCGGRMHE